jgi:hypothetical protein
VDAPVTPENLGLDGPVVKEFHLPSFAGNCNFDHDRVLPMLIEAVVDLALAEVVQEGEEPGVLGNHRSNL